MKLYARLVGTRSAPRRRWWQVVPPWCDPKQRPAVAWTSHRVPFTMTGGKDRLAFPPARLTNSSTLVWSATDWPPGVEVREVHVEDEAGTLLFHVPLEVPRGDLSRGDTISAPVGAITLTID